MYKEFFGLKEAPFNLTPDPRFFYLSRRHQEALAALIYGIRERKGFIMMTGEIGAGKTTLCRTFLNELNHETTNVALILNSFLSDIELLQAINDEYGLPSDLDSKKKLIDELNRFLLSEADKGKTTVLIIDEAQNLSRDVLEQIRMLSNLETESSKLIQIVLMGQPELSRNLAMPELEQLAQRIMVRCHIGPLDKEEIHHYIRHRLAVAGARISISVTPAALNRIYHFSRGIPRRINVLCDRALLAAYVAGNFWIDDKVISSAEKEVQGFRHGGGLRLGGIKLQIRPMAILAIFGGLALIAGAVGSIKLALRMERPSEKQVIHASEKKKVTSPKPEATPKKTLPPKVASSSINATTHTAVASAAQLANNKPTTGSAIQDWTYDADGIARVADPDFARIASFITIGKLWRFPVPLDNFKNYDKPTILGINLPRIFSGEQINLRSFETTATLKDMMALDFPLVLDVKDAEKRFSPVTVLISCVGDTCVVADPRHGRKEMKLADLEKIVQRITVFYVDPDNLATLSPGDKSEAVTRLRLFLSEQSVWWGGNHNTFNTDFIDAIKRFQSASKQKPSGRIDGPTAACIATKRLSFRPRLNQGGGV